MVEKGDLPSDQLNADSTIDRNTSTVDWAFP